MRDIIIVGTGGFAAEVTEYVTDNCRNIHSYGYQLKGYLDVSDKNLKRYKFEKPSLGDEEAYNPDENDYFLVAIGIHSIRNKIINILKEKRARFMNFIHHTCLISSTSELGQGNIICPYCAIGPNVKIGNHNIINYYSIISHDSVIGDNNIFSPNSIVTSSVNIKNSNFFGSAVTILPSVTIGSNIKVQAGITVDTNINNNSFYFTQSKNTAKTIFSKEED